MLSINNISLKFGETTVLDTLSTGFDKGQLIGLIGPNGAGKSTLLRVLASLQKADSGRVLLEAADVESYSKTQLAKKMTYLPQTGVCHWPLTVERLVSLGRFPHQDNHQLSSEDQQAIERALKQTDCAHLIGRTVNTLSGGERARVMLARALATEADVLLADEPIVALDPRHQIEVMGLLKELAQQGKTVIVVLHELHLAMRYCDQLILLDKGKKVSEGLPDDVLTPANLEAVYGVGALFGSYKNSNWLLPWEIKKEEQA